MKLNSSQKTFCIYVTDEEKEVSYDVKNAKMAKGIHMKIDNFFTSNTKERI